MKLLCKPALSATRAGFFLGYLVLAFAITSTTGGRAQEAGGWSLNKGILRLDGAIAPDSDRRFNPLFVEAMLAVPYPDPIVLVLDSPGGNLSAALKTVRIITAARRESTRIVTVVEGGGRCFSACALLFATGDERRAAPDALFLFHGVRHGAVFADYETAITSYLRVIATADRKLATFLRQARVLEDDIEVAFPASQLRERSFGFVTELD